jgi:hypothetical protein
LRNGHGLGVSPQGTSISAGASDAKARASSTRSAAGMLTRHDATPKLSPTAVDATLPETSMGDYRATSYRGINRRMSRERPVKLLSFLTAGEARVGAHRDDGIADAGLR